MNDQEKLFFLACYALRGFAKPSTVYRIFHNAIPIKRALYYLGKWERKGFYGDGVSEWSGRFYASKLPTQYRELLEGVTSIPIEDYDNDYFASSLIAGYFLPEKGETPDYAFINERRYQLSGKSICRMCGQELPQKCLFCEYYFPFDADSGGCSATMKKTKKDAECKFFCEQNNWTYSWRQYTMGDEPPKTNGET